MEVDSVYISEGDQDYADSESFQQNDSKFVVYLVDASPNQFSCPSDGIQKEERNLHAAVTSIAQNLKRQIRSYDEVAICCFFNTREKQNLQDLNSVFVFDIAERECLERPTAKLLKETFMKEIGSSSESRLNPLYNALLEAQAILRKRSGKTADKRILLFTNEDDPFRDIKGVAKTADKRILLFTNEDDPFRDIKGVAKTAMTRTMLQLLAKHAQDLGISIELLPWSWVDEDFNVSTFYADLIGLEGEDRAQFILTSEESMCSSKEVLDQLSQFSEPVLLSSRYLNDFEELTTLGKGGFGTVVLCKHKLDGREYAMKKIPIESLPVDDQILREVTTLSRLQHQHVVRYYQAFVGSEPESVDSDGSSASDSLTTITPLGANLVEATKLYIQMEYCPRNLHQVLGTVDSKLGWDWFHQLLQGLAYIHGQGVMHRDLTPQNIFLDSKNAIKIGDFGLAKFIEDVDGVCVAKLFEQQPDDVYAVGKASYMAPEIVEGWRYIDEKVDIYSLGIVFLELWESFRTDMERCDVIRYLKENGEPPSEWAAKFPKQAAIMKGLMSADPSHRPSANDIINRMEPLHGKLGEMELRK